MMFATLAGGDYDTKGLVGRGPRVAKRVVRREYGVARAARHMKQAQLPIWREALQKTMRLCGKHVEIPSDFPNFKALGHYREPAVSTPEQLDNLRGLRQGWDRLMDQLMLRVLLRDRFHIWTRGFLKHIAPVYLTRALARATLEQRAENLQYGVQLKRTRKTKKDGEDAPAKAEIKVTFCPIPAIEIDLSQQPPEEDWTLFAEKDGSPYDPVQNVEAELLECFLRHGLPQNALDTPPEPTKRKRKNEQAQDRSSTPEKKKPRTSQSDGLGEGNVDDINNGSVEGPKKNAVGPGEPLQATMQHLRSHVSEQRRPNRTRPGPRKSRARRLLCSGCLECLFYRCRPLLRCHHHQWACKRHHAHLQLPSSP